MKSYKKILSVILILVLILSLMGCVASTPNSTDGTDGTENTQATGSNVEAGGFRVGYARLEIMPKDPVPLAGYGNTERRLSAGFLNYIYTTCIAITDEDDNTVLLFANDLVSPSGVYATPAKNAIQEATGIPVDHIMVNASHTHSAPDTSVTSNANILSYNNFVGEQMTKAAIEALEDRKPAEMYVGSGQTEKLNFVRRYVMEDGSFAGDNFGNWDLTVAAHESEADREMRVIQFKRAGGEDVKDVVLVSWQSHPHLTGGATKYDVSSDIIGEMNDQLQKKGYLSAYFQGGAGNINPWSSLPSENYTRSSINWRDVGKSLANTATTILEDMTQVKTGSVKTSCQTYTGKVNHTQDDLLEIAKEVRQIWTSTNDKNAAMAVGTPAGIQSVYHAGHIITKAGKGLTEDLEVNAVSIGDVAFTFAPFEQFDTNSKYIRDNSPYAMTFALGYSNGGYGYFPSAEAFPHSGYEVTSCPFVQGTAEEVADLFLSMLNGMHD